MKENSEVYTLLLVSAALDLYSPGKPNINEHSFSLLRCGLNEVCSPKGYVEVLMPGTCEYDII